MHPFAPPSETQRDVELWPEAIYRALDLRRVGSFVAHAAAAAAGLRSSGLGSDAAAVADLICGP